MSKILVTGGLGFIGSNFILRIINNCDLIVNIDLETYASVDKSILKFESYENYKHYKVDIADFRKVDKIINKYAFDYIFHFAAESHVDNSINNSLLFCKTNVFGTLNILESYNNLKKKNKLLIHISTDEVFGSIKTGKFNEVSNYKPNSPYSASKASSDHFVRSYYKTHNLPIIITNCSNNFGPYQNREKFIPKIIKSLISNNKIPVYGDGMNIREWIYVDDHIDALIHLSKNGTIGESYCIGSGEELENIKIVKKICQIYDKLNDNKGSERLIIYTEDRKGHDYRYSIDSKKLISTGWNCNSIFEK